MLKKNLKRTTLLIMIILILSLSVVNAQNELTDNSTMQENIPISEEVENSDGGDITTNTPNENNMKKSDVYLSGDEIVIDYIVDGNLFICANSVTIKSQIGGDAFIIADNVTIEEQGYIFSNLFMIGNTLNVEGVVYDLYSAAKTINISGYIYRDIKTSCENLNILGSIGRNAFVSSGNINFTSESNNTNGSISGDLNYTSSKELSIPEGAVSGTVNFQQEVISKTDTTQNYILTIGTFITTVVLVWLMILWLKPKFAENTNYLATKKLLPIIGFGILTPFVLIIGSIILFILNITAIFGIFSILLLFILLAISTSIFIIIVNNLVCNKLKIEKTVQKLGILIVSSLVFYLIGLVPFIGTILYLIAIIIGMGVVSYCIIKKNKLNTTKTEDLTENSIEIND